MDNKTILARIRNQTWNQVADQVEEQVLSRSLDHQTWNQFRDQVSSLVWKINDQIWDQISGDIRNKR